MGGLDPAKILIVLLVAVIVLGPERLPKAARQIGGLWRELTKLRERLENEVRGAIPDLDLPKIPTLPARGITGYIAGMMTSAVSSGAGEATAGAASNAQAGAMTEEALGPPLGPPLEGDVSVLDVNARPGSMPATDTVGGRLPRGTTEWQPSYAPSFEHSELPAGWYTVGAGAPGYASGSTLAPVPSSVVSGPLGIEAPITLDEPGWN
jgi:sec-independent protein translocase protein TatB